MVTVSGYESRQGTDGKDFFVLILQGGIEFVFSQKTGLPYATSKKCNMLATFDEETCKSLVGKEMPGSIQKVQLEESYDYTIPRTGEVVQLNYNYVYSPLESGSVERAVFHEAE